MKYSPTQRPALKEPLKKYNIDVDLQSFSVVMDPCCQIGEKTISLTPLIQIRSAFLDNQYLTEDLTRINRKMEPQQAMPPHAWEQLPSEKKQERLSVGRAYAFPNLFVFEKHDLLPKYALHRKTTRIETNYYMINSRDIHKLCCDKIVSPENAPLESKVLELSIETRQELRDKIASHFGAVPKEDKILED